MKAVFNLNILLIVLLVMLQSCSQVSETSGRSGKSEKKGDSSLAEEKKSEDDQSEPADESENVSGYQLAVSFEASTNGKPGEFSDAYYIRPDGSRIAITQPVERTAAAAVARAVFSILCNDLPSFSNVDIETNGQEHIVFTKIDLSTQTEPGIFWPDRRLPDGTLEPVVLDFGTYSKNRKRYFELVLPERDRREELFKLALAQQKVYGACVPPPVVLEFDNPTNLFATRSPRIQWKHRKIVIQGKEYSPLYVFSLRDEQSCAVSGTIRASVATSSNFAVVPSLPNDGKYYICLDAKFQLRDVGGNQILRIDSIAAPDTIVIDTQVAPDTVVRSPDLSKRFSTNSVTLRGTCESGATLHTFLDDRGGLDSDNITYSASVGCIDGSFEIPLEFQVSDQGLDKEYNPKFSIQTRDVAGNDSVPTRFTLRFFPTATADLSLLGVAIDGKRNGVLIPASSADREIKGYCAFGASVNISYVDAAEKFAAQAGSLNPAVIQCNTACNSQDMDSLAALGIVPPSSASCSSTSVKNKIGIFSAKLALKGLMSQPGIREIKVSQESANKEDKSSPTLTAAMLYEFQGRSDFKQSALTPRLPATFSHTASSASAHEIVFGVNIAADGDWVAVSAPWETVRDALGVEVKKAGSVYVYKRVGTKLLPVGTPIQPEAPVDLTKPSLFNLGSQSSGLAFGYSVSILQVSADEAILAVNTVGNVYRDTFLGADGRVTLYRIKNNIVSRIPHLIKAQSPACQYKNTTGADLLSESIQPPALPLMGGGMFGVSSAITMTAKGNKILFVGHPGEDDTRKGEVYAFLIKANDVECLQRVSRPVEILEMEEFGSANFLLSLLTSDLGQFGKQISASKNTVVIGTPGHSLNEEVASIGAAHAFEIIERDGEAIRFEEQKLLPESSIAGDRFGAAVAIDGDTIAVSGSTVFRKGEGSFVTIFKKVAKAVPLVGYEWKRRQTIKAADLGIAKVDGSRADELAIGYSVALRGNTLVIGAREDDYVNLSGLTDAEAAKPLPVGKAFVLTRATSDASFSLKSDNLVLQNVKEPVRTGPKSAFNQYFAGSVAIAGDAILVGAPEDITWADHISPPNGASRWSTLGQVLIWTNPEMP